MTTEAEHDNGNPEVVNLVDSQTEKIEADLVRTTRSYINSVEAEEVDLFQSGSMNISTTAKQRSWGSLFWQEGPPIWKPIIVSLAG